MITASDVFDSVRSILDDDNSGRYSEAADLSPALNLAVQYLVHVFNVAFEQKKIAPESLRELIRIEVVSVEGAGSTRRANVSSITENLWSIFGVEPDPEMGHLEATTTISPDEFIGTRHRFATRLTLTEWNDRAEDPFSPGTIQSIPSVFVRAAYLGPGRYFNATDDYIFIRPGSVFTDGNVAIWYLINPTIVVDDEDEIEFPYSLFNLLVEKTLNYLSLQQGLENKLGLVTDKEVTQLVTLMNS